MIIERSQNEIAQEIIDFAPGVTELVEEWFAVLSRVNGDREKRIAELESEVKRLSFEVRYLVVGE